MQTSTTYSSTVETFLNGYFDKDFQQDEKVIIDVTGQAPTPGVLPPQRATVLDGRELQGSEADGSEDFYSRFFLKHGFVLLDHTSQVNNWDSGAYAANDALNAGDRTVATFRGENEIESKYLPEVDKLIRERLLPGKKLIIQQGPMLLRRGKNTANPFFGSVVHNDYGLTADDFEDNTNSYGAEESGRQWREFYERDDVRGYTMINFWRTVHMVEPLRHMPLAILDADSVKYDDIVISGLRGFTLTGQITTQLSVRQSDNLRWYYYPEMTTQEVMALNLFHVDKDDPKAPFGACFHSAFEHPLTPDGAEERQSCEHRVGVFILRD